MSSRFGRNQRRKLEAKLREVENDADLSHGAVLAMRRWAKEGLGFNSTFVDDEMRVAVGLAQRAILAGLASDFNPNMQRRFLEAAEQQRAVHEKSLGRQISIIQ